MDELKGKAKVGVNAELKKMMPEIGATAKEIVAKARVAKGVVDALPKDSFYFCNGEQVLELNKDGFHYRGETITDAGAAYKIFMEVMGGMKKTQEAE